MTLTSANRVPILPPVPTDDLIPRATSGYGKLRKVRRRGAYPALPAIDTWSKLIVPAPVSTNVAGISWLLMQQHLDDGSRPVEPAEAP
jgi:hypothetical protein